MALTNQPYLPLFVNDWLSSTKLKMCSARAHGIMINTMLLMHKEDDYGYILLKQKFKQSPKQILNFASQFAKVLPFDLLEIEEGLTELVDENCLYIDGDKLKCNRMVKDADISIKRSLSGSKGGTKTMQKDAVNKTEFASEFAQAKVKANTEYEYIIINVIDYLNKKASSDFKSKTKNTVSHITARINDGYKIEDFKNVIDVKTSQWLNDPKMVGFLRPDTLFSPKFESYLNEYLKTKIVSQSVSSNSSFQINHDDRE